MKQVNEHFEVVVCGGGLAGFCAAVAAARKGAKTALVQDRPVLGGNSSSEIRVTPHGAAQFHAYARETGILSELLIAERALNHEVILENGWTNSVWDMVMYDMAMQTPGLTLYLNTSVISIQQDADKRIHSVTGIIAGAETELTLSGELFIDCTGDGVIADLAGCEWRMGSEGRSEFNEPHAPLEASNDTMGNSIHFKAKDMGRPVPFVAPDWAVPYEDASFFYDQGRIPYDIRGGYWWLEIGIPWHTIYDNETIRHELTRHTLGVWNWIKNINPHTRELAANYALDWIGQVPGKRESRRIIGEYFMTEHDPQNRTVFDDEIAFGGWFLDLHTPGGLLAATSEPASAEGYSETSEYAIKSYCGPYGIPLRMLIARDAPNLMMAGRNVSTTHAALGTVRVMATTALMGQAAGTAAAYALKANMPIRQVPVQAIRTIQQQLLRDGCFLPNYRNVDELDLARGARVTASSTALCYGAGPESRGVIELSGIWPASSESRSAEADRLLQRRGQWIQLSTAEVSTLSVCVSNTSDEVQVVKAWLVPVDNIWDYRVATGRVVEQTELHIAPGAQQWVTWELALQAGRDYEQDTYVRLDLAASPAIIWHSAGTIIPGHLSAFEMGAGRMRRFGTGVTMSYRISPGQPCFAPAQVISGVTRPHQATNLWKSDERQPLPQWLQLEWDEAQTVSEIDLTFAGHLIREYHAYPPLYQDPQCVKSYRLEAWVSADDSRGAGAGEDTGESGQWVQLAHVTGNYQRLRKHKLTDAISATKLRFVAEATHGDPSAMLYEIRVYA